MASECRSGPTERSTKDSGKTARQTAKVFLCLSTGKFTHVDGDIYEGEWKEDKACGVGTYKHFNGAKYEGQWLDDYQHGKGV